MTPPEPRSAKQARVNAPDIMAKAETAPSYWTQISSGAAIHATART